MGVSSDYGSVVVIGGNSFYSIEGIAVSDEENSSFNFPFVRMTRNEGTDRTYGVNADTSLANIEILKDVGELNLNLLAKISQGIGSNTGTNENNGKLTQTVININGDSIPDIIQATDSGIKVFAGKKSGTASDSSLSYAEEYEVSGIKINSTHSTMNINGASLSPGGSVSLEFNKGKPSHVKLSAGTSGGGEKSSAEGWSSVDAGLVDINGDGLPDYFNGSSVLLNKGKEFEPSNLISISADNMSESSISSYSVNANVGKSSVHGESLVTGVSFGGGLSYSVSSNTTKKMFIDINGDGLCDRVEQNAGAISVFYNTGNSFAKSDNVQLPSWNLDDSQNASLVTGKDADFELGQFGNLPLIGQATEQLVNVLPVCNPFAPEEIDSMEFSSTISLSVSGNAGLSFTFPIKIPIASISVNMTCAGGNGLSGSSSINAVNVSMTDLDGDGLPDHVLRIPNHATYWKRNIAGRYGQL